MDLSTIIQSFPVRTDEECRGWSWEHEILPRLKAAGIPARFWKRIDSWGCEAQERVFNVCEGMCSGSGAIIALTGARGTGKTTICAQMAIRRAEDETRPPWDRQPPYRKLVDLIGRYKPLYADFGSVDMDQIAAARDVFCTTPALAFIDEIHECQDMKLGNRVLTDLLDRRYASNRDTILISNQSVQEFFDSVSDSVLSRIAEHGQIISCQWASWRTQQ